MKAGFFQIAGHTLSCADKAAKRAALSTNIYQQEGGKRARLDISAPVRHSQPEVDPGCHSQQEGYPDAHLFPQ